MKNLKIVNSSEHKDIVAELKSLASNGAHFTNGTFAFKPELVVPTTLAGFRRVLNSQSHLPIIVAINSDKSMTSLGKSDFESQEIRANKVAEPLAKTFANNQVIIIFYDETTPTALYDALAKNNLTRTLHKWGYGTTPDAPKIEGAENFELVYGFPLPNDIKPVCYDDTAKADKPQSIIVDDLRDVLISRNNRVLFDLPEELNLYKEDQSSSKHLDLALHN